MACCYIRRDIKISFLHSFTPTIRIPPQLQAHTQPESSCAQEERLEQVSQCLETVYTSINASNICNMPSGPQKLEHSLVPRPFLYGRGERGKEGSGE